MYMFAMYMGTPKSEAKVSINYLLDISLVLKSIFAKTLTFDATLKTTSSETHYTTSLTNGICLQAMTSEDYKKREKL